MFHFLFKYTNNQWIAIIIAITLVTLKFLLEWNTGFGLYDEGGLWYGIWRTSIGDIPLLDFIIYDPGRYWWGALFVKIFGNTPYALRFSCAAFGMLGVYSGICIARRLSTNLLWLLLVGFILTAWIFPQYKSFDSSASLLTLLFIIRLLEKPSDRRILEAGIVAGGVAIISRNHGIYAVLCLMVILFLILPQTKHFKWKNLCFLLSGITIGYSPILFMIMFVPGFSEAWFDSILRIIEAGRTNDTLWTGWPWLVLKRDIATLGYFITLRSVDFIKGLFYIISLIVTILTFLLVLRYRHKQLSPIHSVFIAAGTLATFYSHYIFSRADIDHFATGNKPLLLAILAFPFLIPIKFRTGVFTVTISALITTTYFGGITLSPAFKRFIIAPPNYWTETNILDTRIWVDPITNRQLSAIENVNRLIKERDSIAIFPNLPGVYWLLNQKAPINDIYMMGWLSLTKDRQNKVADKILQEKIEWVLWEKSSASNDMHKLKTRLDEQFKPICEWKDIGWLLLKKQLPVSQSS